MLLTALVMLACVPVEAPPEAWPVSGCSAPEPFSALGRRSRSQEVWLEVEPDVRLRLHARWPRRDDCYTAVVLVPPGFEAGKRIVDFPQGAMLVDHGVAVLSFDPRGRGYSWGDEDANGPTGQDDLAAVLRWLASQEAVDPTQVVVSSRSFGGALAAGALGRNDDLAVAGWVDVESPGYLREDLAYAPDTNTERFEQYAPDDPDEADLWWAEREPARLIVDVTAPYHRFQGLPDHALGERTVHAAAMLENAEIASSLSYNLQAIEHDEVTAERIREDAIVDGVDPDATIVGEAVLAFFGVPHD